MARIGKSSGKKRLLPPSELQFAWAIAQRAEAKTYEKGRAAQREALGAVRIEAAVEAAAIAAAAIAAASPDAANGVPKIPLPPEVTARPTMLAPTPTRQMVRPPSHLVFRTRVVTRGSKPK